jgi:transcriptional regulator with XRE-family HTH domain
MMIGERLRAIREAKKMSQGDIEKRTGLFRCYVSRVENGHTVPAIETLEKWARALDVHLAQLFLLDGAPVPKDILPRIKENQRIAARHAEPRSTNRQHGGELKTTRPEFAAVNCSKDGALKTLSSFRVWLRASIRSPIDVLSRDLPSLSLRRFR